MLLVVIVLMLTNVCGSVTSKRVFYHWLWWYNTIL